MWDRTKSMAMMSKNSSTYIVKLIAFGLGVQVVERRGGQYCNILLMQIMFINLFLYSHSSVRKKLISYYAYQEVLYYNCKFHVSWSMGFDSREELMWMYKVNAYNV